LPDNTVHEFGKPNLQHHPSVTSMQSHKI